VIGFDLLCAVLGCFWLLDWLAYLPLFDQFFGRHRWLHPLWLLCALALVAGGPLARLWASAFFYIVYRHYYIDTRWSSVRRGGGAPGFMNHWAAAALLLLQFGAFLDSTGWVAEQILWMVRVDFAVIMMCAGTYKFMVGYWNGEGMEYGQANPLWGYWWRFFQSRPPNGPLSSALNALASSLEMVAGVLLLFPSTRWAGGLLVSLSFVYVALLIRLGRLAWLMAALPLFYHPQVLPTLLAQTPVHLDFALPGYLCWLYVALLPLVKGMQYWNLFANRSLPQPLQDWLSRYANFVPIIIWRVFTPDVTNFFVRIYALHEGRRIAVLDEQTFRLRNVSWNNLRFWHVTESIALVSVFTTLKYFPGNRDLFKHKLLAYSHSLSRKEEQLLFEYVSIQKAAERFEFVPVATWTVGLRDGSVREHKFMQDFDWAKPPKFSPLRTSTAPGVFTPVS
jgi:hypothetical protein